MSVCESCRNTPHLPPSNEDNTLPPGTILNRGRIMLGKIMNKPGGFGITYRAVYIRDNMATPCAVKEVFVGRYCERTSDGHVAARSDVPSARTYFENALSAFSDEKTILIALSSQGIRGVPHYIDQCDENGTLYMAMELLNGFTLMDYIKRYDNGLPLELALPIFNDLLLILQQIHSTTVNLGALSSGVLHRDVSADNVFLTREEGSSALKVHLLDYGAARLQAALKNGTREEATKKHLYTADEQLQKLPQGPYTDLYAVGILMHRTLTHQWPTRQPDGSHSSMINLVPSIPPELDRVYLRATQTDPAKRYQSAEEFRKALSKATGSGMADPRKLIIGGAAVFIAVAGIATAMLLMGGDPATDGPSVTAVPQVTATQAVDGDPTTEPSPTPTTGPTPPPAPRIVSLNAESDLVLGPNETYAFTPEYAGGTIPVRGKEISIESGDRHIADWQYDSKTGAIKLNTYNTEGATSITITCGEQTFTIGISMQRPEATAQPDLQNRAVPPTLSNAFVRIAARTPFYEKAGNEFQQCGVIYEDALVYLLQVSGSAPEAHIVMNVDGRSRYYYVPLDRLTLPTAAEQRAYDDALNTDSWTVLGNVKLLPVRVAESLEQLPRIDGLDLSGDLFLQSEHLSRVPLLTSNGVPRLDVSVEDPSIAAAQQQDGELLVSGLKSGSTTITISSDEDHTVQLTVRVMSEAPVVNALDPVEFIPAYTTPGSEWQHIICPNIFQGVPGFDGSLMLTGQNGVVEGEIVRNDSGEITLLLKAVGTGETTAVLTDGWNRLEIPVQSLAPRIADWDENDLTLSYGSSTTLNFLTQYGTPTLICSDDNGLLTLSASESGDSLTIQTNGVGETVLRVSTGAGADYSRRVVVEKASIAVEFPEQGSDITYGQALAASLLPSNEYGAFVWEDGESCPDAGTQAHTIRFVPDAAASALYHFTNAETSEALVTVAKAPMPEPLWPVPSSLIYGQRLEESELIGSDPLGEFFWAEASAGLPDAGDHEFLLGFRPNARALQNYAYTSDVCMQYMTIHVAPQPVVTLPPLTTTDLVYGQSLQESGLRCDTTLGQYVWTDPEHRPQAGEASFGVRFVPDGSIEHNYDFSGLTAQTEAALTIHPAQADTPILPSAATIRYLQPLRDSVLSDSDEHGSFAWKNPDALLEAGSRSALIVYTPYDTHNYSYAGIPMEYEIPVSVSPADAPAFTWPETLTMTYGQTLDSIMPASDGNGSFRWLEGGAQPEAGQHAFTLCYDPVDQANYTYEGVALRQDVPVQVNRQPVTALENWPAPAEAIVYDQRLNETPLTFTANDLGSFSIVEDERAYMVGTLPVTLRFTPFEEALRNYDFSTLDMEHQTDVQVGKAPAPDIHWPTNAAIRYGQSVGDFVLPQDDSLGAFSWKDAALSFSIGTHAAEVEFTPALSDFYDYTDMELTRAITVTVLPADAPAFTWPETLTMTYGQTLDSILPASDGNGSFRWLEGGAQPEAGRHAFTLCYDPVDQVNYTYEGVALRQDVSVQVNRQPVTALESWPAPAEAIVYDQMLNETPLTFIANDLGSFSIVEDYRAYTVGTIPVTLRFTPSEEALHNYDFSTLDMEQQTDVQVGKAPAPDIHWPTDATIRYGQSVGDFVLPQNDASLGSFSWKDASCTFKLGGHSADIVFTPALSDFYDYTNVELTRAITVTVSPADAPEFTWPSEITLTYGQALYDAELPVDAHGKFIWAASAIQPEAGTAEYTLRYIPNDTINYDYDDVRTEASVTVVTKKKAVTQLARWPETSPITYGQACRDSELSIKKNEYGRFSIAAEDQRSQPAAGSTMVTVVFTPSAQAEKNYDFSQLEKTRSLPLQVKRQKAPAIQWPAALPIRFNETLAQSVLVDEDPHGSFRWENPEYRPDRVGSFTARVIFTPDDQDNYAYQPGDLVKEISFTVEKAAAPAISWPAEILLVYGQRLSEVCPPADENGYFQWGEMSAMPEAGESQHTLIYIPNDEENYAYHRSDIEKKITVITSQKEVTSVDWPSVLPITYGESLLSAALSDTTCAYGSFFIEIGDQGKRDLTPDAGEAFVVVRFKPSEEASRYYVFDGLTMTKELPVRVNRKKVGSIALPEGSAIAYGQPLSQSVLSQNDPLGVFRWEDDSITADAVPEFTATVIFEPADEKNYDYSGVEKSRSLTISTTRAKLTDIGQWPVPGSIRYGQTLGDSALSFTQNEYGDFSVDSAGRTPQSVGRESVTLRFTPHEHALKYYSFDAVEKTKASEITVTQAPAPDFDWPALPALTYGQTLGSVQLPQEDEHGVFVWDDEKHVISKAGSYQVAVRYIPHDTVNYDYSRVQCGKTFTVTVGKAPVTDIGTWPTLGDITYTQQLSEAKLLSGAPNPYGSFVVMDGHTRPDAGQHTVTLLFTPSAEAQQRYDFSKAETSRQVSINVRPAPAPKISWPAVSPAITYGESLSASALPQPDVNGVFSWKQSGFTPDRAGSHEVRIVYKPLDTRNYSYDGVPLENTIRITVERARVTSLDQWPTALPIVYGQSPSEAVLFGSSAYGSFSIPDTKPVQTTGVVTCAVEFTPSEEAQINYDFSGLKKTRAIELTVNPAPAPAIQWPAVSDIVYGQSLSSASFTRKDANGAFSWKDSSIVPDQTGRSRAVMVYTPKDEKNYDYTNVDLEREVFFTVNRAGVTQLTWPDVLPLTYGQKFSEAQLSFTSDAYGTYEIVQSNTVPKAGTCQCAIRFTPDREAQVYYDFSKLNTTRQTTVVVNKAKAEQIQWPTASEISYLQPLSASVLSRSSDAHGAFRWKNDSIIPSDVGPFTATVVYTPRDRDNYDYSGMALEHQLQVTVNKATLASIPDWPDALPLTYGQKLSDTKLSAYANDYGTFSLEADDTKPKAGNAHVTVRFTPSAQTMKHYQYGEDLLTRQLRVTVNKVAAPAVSWPGIQGAYRYGDSWDDVYLSSWSDGNGAFQWENASAPLSAGENNHVLRYIPADSQNYDYNGVTLKRTYSVSCSAPALQTISASASTVAQKDAITVSFTTDMPAATQLDDVQLLKDAPLLLADLHSGLDFVGLSRTRVRSVFNVQTMSRYEELELSAQYATGFTHGGFALATAGPGPQCVIHADAANRLLTAIANGHLLRYPFDEVGRAVQPQALRLPEEIAESPDIAYSVSADGSVVVLAGMHDGLIITDALLVNRDSGRAWYLFDLAGCTRFALSPDASKLSYVSDGHVRLLTLSRPATDEELARRTPYTGTVFNYLADGKLATSPVAGTDAAYSLTQPTLNGTRVRIVSNDVQHDISLSGKLVLSGMSLRYSGRINTDLSLDQFARSGSSRSQQLTQLLQRIAQSSGGNTGISASLGKDSSVFQVTGITDGQVTLKAVTPGTDTLTLTDAWGNQKSVQLTCSTVITGLRSSSVTFSATDKTATVKLNTLPGYAVPKVTVTSKPSGVTVSQSGDTLTLKASGYVAGNVVISAEGKSYTIGLQTTDSLTGFTTSCSYSGGSPSVTLRLSTYSGTGSAVNSVALSSNSRWQISSRSASDCTITLKPKSGSQRYGSQESVTLTLNGSTVTKSFTVPNYITGVSSSMSITEGETRQLSVRTLYGSLNGVTCKSDAALKVNAASGGYDVQVSSAAGSSASITLTDGGGLKHTVSVSITMWRLGPGYMEDSDTIKAVRTVLNAGNYTTVKSKKGTWDSHLTKGVNAWQKAHGYPQTDYLTLAQYNQLIAEGGGAINTSTGQYAARKNSAIKPMQIAVASDGLYVIDSEGWLIRLSAEGRVLDGVCYNSGSFTQVLESNGSNAVFRTADNGYFAVGSIQYEGLNLSGIKSYPWLNSFSFSDTFSTWPETFKTSGGVAVLLDSAHTYSVVSGTKVTSERTLKPDSAMYWVSGNKASYLVPLCTTRTGTLSVNDIATLDMYNGTILYATKDNKLYVYGPTSQAIAPFKLQSYKDSVRNVPLRISGSTLSTGNKISAIELGCSNLALILQDGTAVVAGSNSSSLKNGNGFSYLTVNEGSVRNLNGIREIALTKDGVYALTGSNRLYYRSADSNAEMTLLASNVRDVAFNDSYAYAVLADDTVVRYSKTTRTILLQNGVIN